jgi:uncharacterized repeat protein (TIGR03803 family)
VDTAGHATVLHGFTGGSDGERPYAGVVGDSAGNLYGTAYLGGTYDAGIVYKVDATGHETVLYTFTGGADGGMPIAGVTLDSAGNLYGCTSAGGSANDGVVFKLDPTGQETVLHSFTGSPGDVASPQAAPLLDSAGNLYGTTYGGGTAGSAGTVWKVDATGHETVLYNFGGANGYAPYAGVVRDSAGNLYGTTHDNGEEGQVYKLDAAGNQTVLYSFTGGADGGSPIGGVVRDSAGNLYGATETGGAAGAGVVYKIDPTGHETVLYTFTGGADGNGPEGGVIRDSAGNLYGTTSSGGVGNGTVYEVSAAGAESVLYSFPGPEDGASPAYAGVILGSAGNLFGVTAAGGVPNQGVVYEVDATGHETVLYTFTGGADGADPWGNLAQDSSGNLYGTTKTGGAAGAGVVYKLAPNGSLVVLHSFAGGTDGANPEAGVVIDSSGNLYGTTYAGGPSNVGVVYKLDSAANETVLYSFMGGSDGANPTAGVTLDSSGSLYGTTYSGGTPGNAGTVYKVDATGHETVLYSFTGAADGGSPAGGVVFDAAGNLYGTTESSGIGGVVFKLDPAGHETVLHTFGRHGDGQNPLAGVVLDAAGNLYGTTFQGGPGYHGIVFELDPAGNLTVLHAFTGHADGSYPYAGVVLDSAGNVYGTTSEGGKKDTGVVFEIEP